MGRNYETRHIFMAIAIVILLISPILLLIAPSLVANTLYHSADNWHVFVPGMGYVLYGVGFFLLVLSPAIIFLLDIRKKSIVYSFIIVLLSGLSFYFASSLYISFSNDSISYGTLFPNEQNTYLWDEVERAVYYGIPPEEGFSKYEFFFNDGKDMKLTENGYVKTMRDGIFSKVNVEIIWVE